MTAKSMDRFKDRLNRAFFKQENLPEFGGDEKLQRQYEECDLINSGLSTVSKAIQSNQLYDRVSPDGADIEKKYDTLKTKYPSYKIAQNMMIAAEKLDIQVRTDFSPGAVYNSPTPLPLPSDRVTDRGGGDCSSEICHPLSRMYKETAKEMEFMAKQQFTFENEVNATVLGKFTDFFQTFESVNNTLKQLQKHCVDVQTSEKSLEDARSKLSRCDASSEDGKQTLVKLQAKVESADKYHKQNVERVQKERDLLSQGVQGFVRSETEIGNSLIKYVTLCQDYHKNCFEILNRLVPELEKWRDKSSLLPPFETSLEKHLSQTGRKIALPIEATTCWLHHNSAWREQGVFRVGGNMKIVRILQEKIDRFQAVEEDFAESTTMTTLLKAYLRSLPHSLFTVTGLQKLKDQYTSLSKKGADESAMVWRFADIIDSLPAANKNNLRPIFSILHQVLQNESENKMSADNIGTCIGPSFDSEKLELKMGVDIASLDLQQTTNYIVAVLVKHAPRIFKLEENPHVFRSLSDVLNPDLNPPIKPVPLDEQSESSDSQSEAREAPQPTPRRAAGHRRVHSSDKVLGPSQTAPVPPKPLAPDQLASGSHKKKAPKAPNASGSKSSLLEGCDNPGFDLHSADNGPQVETELSHSSENLTNGNSAASASSSSTVELGVDNRQSKLLDGTKPKPNPRSFRVPRPTVAPPPPPASGASSPLTESKNLEPPQRVPAGESTSGLSPDAEISYVPSLENTNSTHF